MILSLNCNLSRAVRFTGIKSYNGEKKKFIISSIIAGALFAVLPVSLIAEEPIDDEVVELPSYEVRGTNNTEGPYQMPNSMASGFRAQAVLDTPFSLATFSADFIRDTQARTLLDLTRNDPSVTPAEEPLWYDRINIRGFYLSTDAVFRDGLGINDQGTIALDNKEAVEITKGLSSTRQGITSPGGTLNYVVKRPLAAPLTTATVHGNGFGGFGATADVSRRFGTEERFGVRVNIAAEDLRTFIDGIEGDRVFAAAAFDWRATKRLLLGVEFEHQDKELTSFGGLGTWSFPDEAAARAFLPRLDAETVATQTWAVEPNQQSYISGRAIYEIATGWRLRLAAQRAELSRDQRGISASNIQDNGDYDIYYYFSPDQDRNNTAALAVIEGDIETGSVLHELALGYDFIRRDMTYGSGFYDTIGSGNLFDDVVLSDPDPTVGASSLQFRSNQHSGFFTNTAKFNEWLQVFTGVRLTRLQNNRQTSPGVLTETYDKNVVTPTFGLVIKPRSFLSIYASYAEGIEQGGTAPDTAANSGQIFDPLKSEQIEVGAKWELPAGALFTIAAFEIDKGLEFIDPGSNLYVQNGRQVHRGIEATIAGRVGDHLRLIAGASWLDATVTRTDDLLLIGKRPQGVPEWQANFYADYNLSDFVDGLSVNAGIYYTGEKPIDFYNTWSADSYVRLDVGLRYRHRIGESTTVTWRLGVENVSDEVYLANTTFGYLNFGAPRTFKLSATFDF